jgi:Rieske Fe-S protein
MDRGSTTRRALLGSGLLGAGGLVLASRGVFRGAAEASRAAYDLGTVDAVRADLATRQHGVRAYENLRLALVRYRPLRQYAAVNADVTAAGVLALRMRCTHLGCYAPHCESSGWFECPCHDSRFNGAGEYEYGPAPRGLDRYHLVVKAQPNGAPDRLAVDLTTIVPGPPRGVETVDSAPTGPHCVE